MSFFRYSLIYIHTLRARVIALGRYQSTIIPLESTIVQGSSCSGNRAPLTLENSGGKRRKRSCSCSADLMFCELVNASAYSSIDQLRYTGLIS